MLLTNILLGIIIFFMAVIFGCLSNIERKLSKEEYERMTKFYKTLMESIDKKKKGTINKEVTK